MATLQQVNDFIAKIAPLAQNQYNMGKNILPSVCIAQAACESAWGTSTKMINANALFGIKVGSNKTHFGNAWHDKAYSTKTKECYDGKTYVSITDMFRAYDSLSDSVEDYYDMLCSCKRYAGAVGNSSAYASICAIKNGGYATSPTYVNTIMSIINAHDLTQYDSKKVVNSVANAYVGMAVVVSSYYNTADSDQPIIATKTGIVESIIDGVKNPYKLRGIGYCNLGDMRQDVTKEIIMQGYKYKIGDVVVVSSHYKNSNDTPDKAVILPQYVIMTIDGVDVGAKNPYHTKDFNTWLNDGDIRSYAK